MTGARILGDWGSTRLRLWLSRGGEIVDRSEGPGIIGRTAPPAEILRDAIAPWREQAVIERITLCGMAGARGGLCETSYADCPVSLTSWIGAATRFAFDGIPVCIAAGCGVGSEDVMRGEETQAFGSMSLRPDLSEGRQWLVLPGTHSKWLSVSEGAILSFRTFVTGELFALLQPSSLLGAADTSEVGGDAGEGFTAGLLRSAEASGLLGKMFSTRVAQLRQGRSADWARGFLSGLLIGTEVAEMRVAGLLPDSVLLICDAGLMESYRGALAANGVACVALDGEACALAGLRLLDDYD